MTWVAVAIGGSALVGAGASIIGGNRAADAAEQGAAIASDTQLRSLRAGLALGRPGIEVGNSALGVLASLFGLPAPSGVDFNQIENILDPSTGEGGVSIAPGASEVQQAFRQYAGRDATQREIDYYTDRERGDQLYTDVIQPGQPEQEFVGGSQVNPSTATLEGLINNNPGIQHVRQEGENAIARGAAARGLNQSGAALRDLTSFNSGLAATNYQNLVLNPLFQLAGFGNQQTAQQQGMISNTGSNLSNIALGASDARGSAYQNTGNIIGNTANDIGGALLINQMGRNSRVTSANNMIDQYFNDPRVF